MYVYLDYFNTIRAFSYDPLEIDGCVSLEVPDLPESAWFNLIGRTLKLRNRKKQMDLRVAFICNWDQQCGISIYSKFLVNAIRPKVAELKIFSEHGAAESDEVLPCWHRGQSMIAAVEAVKAWNPDLVVVQHEFGLFPRATHFLQMLQNLDELPYVVALHSVYEHLDKSVCTAAIKNIIVHSEDAKQTLRRTGNNSNVFVIPHGCTIIDNNSELWNIFQTPYCMVQFGFGFFYKGVDVALDAIHILKTTNPEKYKEIFYCYLCSSNDKTSAIHNEYYKFLLTKIEQLNLQENVAIIRKYQTDATLNHYLRTAKMALFPYLTDPNNTVYGASGAIRIAMANGIPVIASPSHLFDDLQDVLPRPGNAEDLAKEIDLVFSNSEYRNAILHKCKQFLSDNTWDAVADKYLALCEEIN